MIYRHFLILLVPVWIFAGTALARVAFSALQKRANSWWAFPLYLSLFIPGFCIFIAGIFAIFAVSFL